MFLNYNLLSAGDALICGKDYKKFLKANSMDESRADECFKSMLIVSVDPSFLPSSFNLN